MRHLVKVAEERVAEVGRHGAQREPSRLCRVAAQVQRVDVVVAAGERADGNRLGTYEAKGLVWALPGPKAWCAEAGRSPWTA